MPEHAPKLHAARSGGPTDLPPVGAPPKTKALTQEEMALLFRACGVKAGLRHADRNHALLAVAYSTAARGSEICGMNWQGVRWGASRLLYWSPKVSRWFDSPLHQKAVSGLQRLLRGCGEFSPTGPIFRSQKGGALTTSGLRDLFKKLARDAGIDPARVHPHVFRATRLTHLIEAGHSLAIVQRLAGHRSVTTTQRYIHLAQGAVDDAATGSWF